MALDERWFGADMDPMYHSYRRSFAALLRMGWRSATGRSKGCKMSMPTARLLFHVYNKILEVARDHGQQRDPLMAWARTSNELLERCLVSVFVEAEADIGSLNSKYDFADGALYCMVSLRCLWH